MMVDRQNDLKDTLYHGVRHRFGALGAEVVYPVQLPAVEELNLGDEWTPGTVNCL